MSLYIYAEPARTDIFTASGDATPIDPAIAPFAETLREAYLQRVGAYNQALSGEYAAQGDDSPEPPASAYPRLMLQGENDEKGEDIVIDGDLFATLFDLYTIDGWAPIAQIQTSLERKSKAKSQPDRSAGGRPELKWFVAYTFFIYCRNMLALLIRESLMDMERRAAVRIIARLSVTASKVSGAVKDFKLTEHKERTMGPENSMPNKFSVFEFADKKLIQAVMTAVRDAVTQRVAWDNLVRSIESYKEALDNIDGLISSKEAALVKPRDFEVEERKRLQDLVANISSVRDASRNYYEQMKTIIGLNCPLALLVLDRLKPGFSQGEFEQVLGAAIWALYKRLDGMAEGIDPLKSQVGLLLAGLPESDTGRVSLEAIQQLYVPENGPEAKLASAAISGLESSPAWFPVLHEMTWRLLVHQGEVTEDSFEYVVMHHYLDTLAARIEELDRQRKSVASFFKELSRLTAALSVALLVTPLAEVAPVLTTVSFRAGLAVMAYQISSATGQLALLDEAFAKTLLEPDAYSMSSLGRLGELVLVRSEFATQLTEQLILELLGIIAAGQWEPVRKLMVARGFLSDIDTILATDESDE